MNPTGKKFISLFLVFSLMMLSVNLYAKERRGAKLIIQRIGDQVRQVKKTRLDGTPWETSEITGIWGELIAVKQNSLLLLDAGGKDVSIDIADIKAIRIVKKSKAWLYGLSIGIAAGAILGYAAGDTGGLPFEFWITAEQKALVFGIAFGVLGALIGGAVGKNLKNKTIHFEGMSDSEIREALDKLRKKARIRDYK